MDRLFLDANVLFSAAYRPGAGLLQLWKLDNAVLCSSRYALAEARINLDEEEQRARLTSSQTQFISSMQHNGSFHEASLCLRKMRRSYSLPSKREPLIC